MSNHNLTSENDRLLDRAELAERWKVTSQTLKRREKDGTLSPVYLHGGRLVRYRLSDIIQLEKPIEL